MSVGPNRLQGFLFARPFGAFSMKILILFFLIAAVYASAGFGGGSSYLAVLAVAGCSMAQMRPAALVCNLVVTGGGSAVFWQKGLLDWRRIWPLFTSVPAAWWGAMWPISDVFFKILLGASLVAAGVLMFFQKEKQAAPKSKNQKPKSEKPVLLAFLGAALGLLAGLTGIGGGIFLAPALHFLRFDEPKKIAATASVFILANSAAGLFGQFFSKNWAIDWAFVGPLALAVAVGGQIGSRLSATFFEPRAVRRVTAALVLYAGLSIWQKLL